MRNINWRQSSKNVFAVLLPFRLAQEFEFINDISADTFSDYGSLARFTRIMKSPAEIREEINKNIFCDL